MSRMTFRLVVNFTSEYDFVQNVSPEASVELSWSGITAHHTASKDLSNQVYAETGQNLPLRGRDLLSNEQQASSNNVHTSAPSETACCAISK